MTISLDSLTSDPVGTENGLVTRNIPSGTQDVSGSEVIIDGYVQTNPNVIVSNFPSEQHVLVDGYVETNPVVIQGTNPWNVSISNFPSDQHVIIDGYVQTNPNVNVTNFPATQAVTQSTSPWVVSSSGNFNNSSVSSIASGAPTSATFVGGEVQAVQSGLTSGDLYPLSLTTTGLLRVDGSNITQPVSGTVTVNQGSAAALSGAWPVEITDGYGNILGTSSNPIITTSKAVNRTTLTFVGSHFNGVSNTETMITFTPYSNFVAGTAGTSFAVDTGKTLRLQSIILSGYNGNGFFNLRISSSGSVTTSTPIIISVYLTGTVNVPIPEGLELTGSVQFGVSQVQTPTGAVFSMTITGYEY